MQISDRGNNIGSADPMDLGRDWKGCERKFHDDEASVYDKTTLKGYAFFDSLIRRYLRRCKSLSARLVFDCGCGTGRAAFIANALGYDVVTMDISMQMLAKVREKSENRRNKDSKLLLVVGDAEQLPFKDKCFDIVVAAGVLHHVQDVPKALAEQLRTLRYKNLLIGDLTYNTAFILRKVDSAMWKLSYFMYSVLKKLGFSLFPFDRSSPYERPLSREYMKELLSRFGLKYKFRVFFHIYSVDLLFPRPAAMLFLWLLNLVNLGRNGNFFVAEVNHAENN